VRTLAETGAYLQETSLQVEQLCAGLSSEQAGFRPQAERWSVDECVEHLATTERFVSISIRPALLGERASPKAVAETLAKSERFSGELLRRDLKIQAPPPAQPSSRYGPWPGSLAELRLTHQNLMELSLSADESWVARLAPHPLLGNSNAAQWLLFAAAHRERHTKQIEDLLQDPAFS